MKNLSGLPEILRRYAEEPKQTEYDSPWKEAIEEYFSDFLLFFFPEVHADINWSKGYTFLDKELQKVVRQATITERNVDKLVQVYRKSGEETWVLIHVDVQSQHETDFSKRMYVYQYRIFDRCGRKVATFVIYADESKKWRPDHYESALWNTKVRFDYSIIKLLDYDMIALETNANPFAIVLLAHLQTKATHRQADARYKIKFRLTKMLYKRGYSKEKILSLYRYIDWMMALPPELEKKLTEDITSYEETYKMAYVTNAERIGYSKGLERGMERGLERGQQDTRRGLLSGCKLGLNLKFGMEGLALLPEIREVDNVDMLYAIQDAIMNVESIAELRNVYQLGTEM